MQLPNMSLSEIVLLFVDRYTMLVGLTTFIIINIIIIIRYTMFTILDKKIVDFFVQLYISIFRSAFTTETRKHLLAFI